MIVIVRRSGAAPHVHRLTTADLCAYLRAANAPPALIDRAAALHNDVVRWAQVAR